MSCGAMLNGIGPCAVNTTGSRGLLQAPRGQVQPFPHLIDRCDAVLHLLNAEAE